MAKIKFSNGVTVNFDGEPTQADIEEIAAQFGGGVPEPAAPQERGLMGKAYDALAVPEAKSREGLKMLAGMVPEVEPTGNAFRDVALNTPRIAVETLAEVAPGFISRGSMLTAGALKGAQLAAPAINAVGRFAGKTAESMSGLGYKTPGVLAEAVKDPTLIFGKGVKKAGELYGKAKDVGDVRESLKFVSKENPTPLTPKLFVRRVLQYVQDGSATPKEALKARQSLDEIKNSIAEESYHATREVLDKLAKTKYAEADKAFSRAVKSDALRQLWGINKGGTPSLLKGGVASVVPLTAPLLSPIAQGTIASGIGVAGKALAPAVRNPRLGLLAEPVLDRFR